MLRRNKEITGKTLSGIAVERMNRMSNKETGRRMAKAMAEFAEACDGFARGLRELSEAIAQQQAEREKEAALRARMCLHRTVAEDGQPLTCYEPKGHEGPHAGRGYAWS